jgi:hypothetical protein
MSTLSNSCHPNPWLSEHAFLMVEGKESAYRCKAYRYMYGQHAENVHGENREVCHGPANSGGTIQQSENRVVCGPTRLMIKVRPKYI